MWQKIKAALFCRSGHRYFWHCLGYPGDGRTCADCGHNQPWAEILPKPPTA